MQWLQWLNLFRRSPKHAHRASFELGQAAAAEEHAVEVLEDLEKINKRKLDVLSRIQELSRQYDDGDELMAQAVEAYREGIRNLTAAPIALQPADKEARREAMEGPSESSTGSRGSSEPKGLPGEADEPPPRRGRGRPKGAKNKPKPKSSPDDERPA